MVVPLNSIPNVSLYQRPGGGRRGRDRMIVEFKTTCAISAYHH
jgi:hypothetical protein